MSHVRTVIEPAPGLTVIVGPNNCGKSAIVNALQCLAYKASAIPFVRHGSRYARVTVETEEGDRIEWAREKDQVSYCINGERTHRGVVPDSLPAKLRLAKVQADDEDTTFDIHFAEQKQPIFLLGQEKHAALFFASSSDTGYLLKMQQTWKSRVNDHKKELKRLNDQLVHDRAVLEAYAPLDGIEAGVRQAEGDFTQLEDHNRELKHLRDWHRRHRRGQRVAHEQEVRLAALNTLTPPPGLQETTPARELAKRWRRVRRVWDRETERLAALALPVEPLIADTSGLSKLVRRLAIQHRDTERQAEIAERLAPLNAPPQLGDPADLAHRLRLANQLQERVTAAEQHIVKLDSELTRVEAELRLYLGTHPECPTCGGTIDPERFLKNQEHAHA